MFSIVVLLLKAAGIHFIRYYDVFNFFVHVRFTYSSNGKRKRIRSMRKQKAILWKRWKLSNAPEDKAL